mgnify:CR=1 FL=1
MNNSSLKKCEMLFDFYELAQSAGFLANGSGNTVAWFDMFYRPSSCAEFDYFASLCGADDSVCFCRDKRLMIDRL